MNESNETDLFFLSPPTHPNSITNTPEFWEGKRGKNACFVMSAVWSLSFSFLTYNTLSPRKMARNFFVTLFPQVPNNIRSSCNHLFLVITEIAKSHLVQHDNSFIVPLPSLHCALSVSSSPVWYMFLLYVLNLSRVSLSCVWTRSSTSIEMHNTFERQGDIH